MVIQRDLYLNRLIARRHNGMAKIVTGIRRCGKSFLLFRLYADWLRSQGVDDEHIIMIQLDNPDYFDMTDAKVLYQHIKGRIKDSAMHYIILDEVQLVNNFVSLVNGLLYHENVDVYVTGSNAKFLSSDVVTEFRGRGDQIKMQPLNFREFMSAYQGSAEKGFEEYMLYGGLPQILTQPTAEQKETFLKDLFAQTYILDIKERYKIRNDQELEGLVNLLASNTACLVNPMRLADTFKSRLKTKITQDTVKNWIDYLEDAFVMERALRYDVKGNNHIGTPYKCYFTDLGLRNARLNFRQVESTHLMENLIYNELRARGFNVDVGVVPVTVRDSEGRQQRQQLEIDFVCNQGSRRYYIQSAWLMDDPEKEAQEQRSLLSVSDNFKKIIVTSRPVPVRRTQEGLTIMSIYDFLLNEASLEL